MSDEGVSVRLLKSRAKRRANAAALDGGPVGASSDTRFSWDIATELLLALIAILAVSTWYRGHLLVWGSDANLPLSLAGISKYFSITDASLGGPDVRKLPFILPLGALLWVWGKLGLPYDPGWLQRVLLVGALTMAGIGMFRLIRSYLPRLETLPAAGASLYYMFNLFALVTIWSPLSNLVFHYCLLPIVLVSWRWALRRRSVGAGVVAGVVWSLALTPSYITTPVVLTDLVLLFAITAVERFRTQDRAARRQVLGAAGTILATWLGMNAFWILPTLYYLGAESARGLAAGTQANLIALNSVPFDKAIRLGGYWGLTSGYKGSPYFPWASFYTRGWGASIAFLLPILALAAIRQLPRSPWARFCPACGSPVDVEQRAVSCSNCGVRSQLRGVADDTAIYIKFFFVVLGISLFFMTGPNEPLGTIKARVMEESGLFAPFRSVYQRFGEYAALAYAPLIGAGLQALTSLLRRGWPRRMDVILGKSAGVALAGVLATMLALPMWTGSLFDSSGVIPSRRVTIPPEYSTVAQWIDAQPGDFNVLPFPNGPTSLTALNWSRGEDGYLGNEPLQLLTGKPFLSGDPSAPYLADLIAQASTGGTRAWPALRFLNVRYIVVHLDADRAYLQGLNGWVGIDTKQVTSTFDTTPGLRLALVAGGLRVYEVTRWKPFQLFAVRYLPSLSVYALPLDEVQPIHYGLLGSGRYFVPAGQLIPGEVLVINHPYDPLWRAEGEPSIRLNPGLTAFRVEGSGSLVVTHQLEAKFPLLLALAPTIVAALAIVAFLWTRRSRHEVSG